MGMGGNGVDGEFRVLDRHGYWKSGYVECARLSPNNLLDGSA